jgi:hypothetical protein
MIPVLITVTMLAAAAAAMLLAIRLPADVEADSKVDLIVFENERGERIEYTRDEALEALAAVQGAARPARREPGGARGGPRRRRRSAGRATTRRPWP